MRTDNVITVSDHAADYAINLNRVRIRKCCSSCAMMSVDGNSCRSKEDENLRKCAMTGKWNHFKFCCDYWAMKDGLKSISTKGNGHVKSKDYLIWRRDEIARMRYLIETAKTSNDLERATKEMTYFNKHAHEIYGKQVYLESGVDAD